jgi:hypothetical protein
MMLLQTVMEMGKSCGLRCGWGIRDEAWTLVSIQDLDLQTENE